MQEDLQCDMHDYKTVAIKAALTGLAEGSYPSSRALADVWTYAFATVQALLQANS